ILPIAMIERKPLQVGRHNIRDRAEPILALFNRDACALFLELDSSVLLGGISNCLARGLRGLADPLACINELIPPHTGVLSLAGFLVDVRGLEQSHPIGPCPIWLWLFLTG